MTFDPFSTDADRDAFKTARKPVRIYVEITFSQKPAQTVHVSVRSGDVIRKFEHEGAILDEIVTFATGETITLASVVEEINKYYSNQQTVAFVAEQQLVIGASLFRAVFQSIDDEVTNWLDMNDGEVEFLVVEPPEGIASLPWPLLNFRNRYCFERHWQIALDYRSSGQMRNVVLFEETPRVLVLSPEPGGLQETGSTEHVAALKNALEEHGVTVTVAEEGSWAEAKELLAQSEYDVLYYYGHGTRSRHGGVVLEFEDSSGQSRQVSPSDLRIAIDQGRSQPALAYINCCHGSASDISNMGIGLIGAAAAVVSNRTIAVQKNAQRQAIDFLANLIIHGRTPQDAYSDLLRGLVQSDLTTMDLRWMTPVLYRAYGQWVPPAAADPSEWTVPDWALFLNRTDECEAFAGAVATLSDESRTCDVVLQVNVGDEEDGIGHLFERLKWEALDATTSPAAFSDIRHCPVTWPDDDTEFLDDATIEAMLSASVGRVGGHSVARSINADLRNLSNSPQAPCALFVTCELPDHANPLAVEDFVCWLSINAHDLFNGSCKGVFCIGVLAKPADRVRVLAAYRKVFGGEEDPGSSGMIARFFGLARTAEPKMPKFAFVEAAPVTTLPSVTSEEIAEFVHSFHRSYSRLPSVDRLPSPIRDYVGHLAIESEGKYARIIRSLKQFNASARRYRAEASRRSNA